MRSKIIEAYKKSLSLSQRQREILIGVVLGDGHLEQLYTSTLARLKVEHSIKQKLYVDWLFNEFKDWVRSKPCVRNVSGFGKMHQNYRFCTYGHELLGGFQHKFYVNRKKIVPNGLGKDISSLTLAVWYMDDGSIKSHKHQGVFLNTQGFALKDIERLQNILKDKFSISSTTREEKNGRQIYLGSEHGRRFMVLIEPHMIFSMRYKIPQILRLT